MDESAWEKSYIRETNHKKRRQMLEEYAAHFGSEDEAYILRKALLEARYLTQREGQGHVDSFIRGWTNLAFLKDSSDGLFGLGRRRNARMARAVLEEWRVAAHMERGDTTRQILYQELFNMTLVYIRLCEQDKGYGSILMGVGQISEAAKVAKIERDILDVCEVPEKLGMREEFSLFIQAAREALREYLEISAE